MRIDHYLKCYSEDELCKGAELLLAGEIKTDIKEITEREFWSPAFGGKEREEREVFRFMPDRFWQCSVSMVAEEYPAVRSRMNYRASICFDKKLELVLSSDCNCPVFQNDRYGCPHVAAALTAFYEEQEGTDFFRGTRLEERLKDLSGADNPFAPGVMKRTDARLRDFLKPSANDNELPVWEAKGSAPIPGNSLLRCEFDIIEQDKRRYLELKAGPQRTYVIKDLPQFMNAVRNKGTYTFGKNSCVVGEENFQRDSQALIHIILRLEQEKGKSALYCSLGNTHDLRALRLSDAGMAQLLELCDGATIAMSSGERIPVQLQRKGLTATLRKKNFGASLKIEPVQIFCKESSRMYLQDSEGIFRVSTSPDENMMLDALLTSNQEAYIRESDLPVFISKMLPFLERNSVLTVKGVRQENYQRETPQFAVYLDLEEQDLISCQPFSCYTGPDIRYPLFSNSIGTLRRNGPAETAFAQKLIATFDSYDSEHGKCYAQRNEDQLFRFLQKEVPALQKESTVYISDRLKRIRVKKLPALQVSVKRESSSLMMNIQTGSITKAEMQEILSAYTLKKKYFRLKDGTYFDFADTDTQVWSTLADLYQHYGKKDPSLFAVPLYRSLYLNEMLSDRDQLTLNGDEHYREILQAAEEDSSNETEVPDSLTGVLRPYQAEGFRWISRLKKMGFGGILADDMGLGKTLQVLTFLLAEKKSASAPSLIVCPASLVYNWKKELEKFTPQLTCVVIAGGPAERTQAIQANRETDVWITSYDLLKRDIAFYEEIPFAHEIVDEAQFIKNQTTQAAKAVRAVHADFRMALTGTPIENRLSELWSIMDYLMPGFLYPYARFQKEFETPISAGNEEGDGSLERLRHMVHPFILRRLKTDVLKELPEKQEEIITVRLEGEQQKIYNAYAARLKHSLEETSDRDFGTAKIQILAEITRLRQICCDPSLVVEDYQGESAKLEACMELISQAVESGHKILLFSQFTSMLDIICSRLAEENVAYYRLDGSTAKEKRIEMVDNFAGDEVPVFCISLKAGGTGLNLTAADIVIHYDPWWNQAAQDQATDRAHRIGQTNKVTVYELVVQDTMEEKIQEIKNGKTKLVEDVLSGGTISSSDFNRSELLQLL